MGSYSRRVGSSLTVGGFRLHPDFEKFCPTSANLSIRSAREILAATQVSSGARRGKFCRDATNCCQGDHLRWPLRRSQPRQRQAPDSDSAQEQPTLTLEDLPLIVIRCSLPLVRARW